MTSPQKYSNDQGLNKNLRDWCYHISAEPLWLGILWPRDSVTQDLRYLWSHLVGPPPIITTEWMPSEPNKGFVRTLFFFSGFILEVWRKLGFDPLESYKPSRRSPWCPRWAWLSSRDASGCSVGHGFNGRRGGSGCPILGALTVVVGHRNFISRNWETLW